MDPGLPGRHVSSPGGCAPSSPPLLLSLSSFLPLGCSHSWIRPSSCLALGLLLSWDFTCFAPQLRSAFRELPLPSKQPLAALLPLFFSPSSAICICGIAFQPCFSLRKYRSPNICCVWPFSCVEHVTLPLPASLLYQSEDKRLWQHDERLEFFFFFFPKSRNHPQFQTGSSDLFRSAAAFVSSSRSQPVCQMLISHWLYRPKRV